MRHHDFRVLSNNVLFQNTFFIFWGVSEMQSGGSVQRLVTADGTYATQSAFSTVNVKKQEER